MWRTGTELFAMGNRPGFSAQCARSRDQCLRFKFESAGLIRREKEDFPQYSSEKWSAVAT